MNQKLKSVFIIVSTFLLAFFLSIILMELGGYLHAYIFSTSCTGSIFVIMNFDKGCQLEGFIYFYLFWLAVFAFGFLKQKIAWLVYVIGTFIFWIAQLYFILSEKLNFLRNELIGSLIIMVCFFVVGWLLAQGGLMVYKKLK